MPSPTTAETFLSFSKAKIKPESNTFTWFGDSVPIDQGSIDISTEGLLSFPVPSYLPEASTYYLAHFSTLIDGAIASTDIKDGTLEVQVDARELAKEIFLTLPGKRRLESKTPVPSIVPLIRYTKPQFALYMGHWQDDLSQYYLDQRIATTDLIAAASKNATYSQTYDRLSSILKGNPTYDDVVSLIRLRDVSADWSSIVADLALQLKVAEAEIVPHVLGLSQAKRTRLMAGLTDETAFFILACSRMTATLPAIAALLESLGSPIQADVGAIAFEEANHTRQIHLSNCNFCDLAIERNDGLTSQVLALSPHAQSMVRTHVEYLASSIFKPESPNAVTKDQPSPKFRNAETTAETSEKAEPISSPINTPTAIAPNELPNQNS